MQRATCCKYGIFFSKIPDRDFYCFEMARCYTCTKRCCCFCGCWRSQCLSGEWKCILQCLDCFQKEKGAEKPTGFDGKLFYAKYKRDQITKPNKDPKLLFYFVDRIHDIFFHFYKHFIFCFF